MKNPKRSLSLGLEGVSFQNGMFFKELTMAMEEAKSVLKRSESADDMMAVSVRLSKLVKEYTGMKLAVNITTDWTSEMIGPHVMIPEVNRNHPLIVQEHRSYMSSGKGMKMIAEAGKGLMGAVDLKTGMVSGVFTEIETDINIPVSFVEHSQNTAAEIAAVILHEVGHMFTFFEFMARSLTTNQVLAGLAKSYVDTDVAEREVLLSTVKKTLSLKDLDVAALATSGDLKTVQTVILSEIVVQTRAELGCNLYDMTSWEYLADEYASRQGAGRDLMVILSRMHKDGGDIFTRSNGAYLFLEGLKIAAILLAVIGSILTPAAAFYFGMVALIMISAETSSPGLYDTPVDRFKRIRNQLVQALKDKRIPKEKIAQLAADIGVIDEIIATCSNRRQLFDVVRDFLSPTSRKYRKQVLLQKELEDLAVNDIFIKSAEIRLAS